MSLNQALHHAKQILREQGAVFRTTEAIRAGVHPRMLYRLKDKGVIKQLSRGLYTFKDDAANPDLIIVASRVPKAVVCLVSSLAFHELTTQVPSSISIAMEKGSESPRLEYPPITLHRFSNDAFREGQERHNVDGVFVNVYSPEKTLADCFKFRNKIGMDVVLEGLRFYKAREPWKIDDLLRFARICRVESVMRPYLEATL